MLRQSAILRLDQKLRSQVLEHPTFTYLRDSSAEAKDQFDTLPKTLMKKDVYVPDTFDAIKVWKGLLTTVKNQGKCGSCWAFATTSTLSDRFNIQSLGKLHIELSAAKLLLCNFMGREFNVAQPENNPDKIADIQVDVLSEGVCQGNTLFDAWRYLYIIGTPVEACVPYNEKLGQGLSFQSLSTFEDDSMLPLCSALTGPIGDMCSDVSFDVFTGNESGTPARFYRCLHIYSVAGVERDGGSEADIRQNIYYWGPVSSGMEIYPDFYTFDAKTEIYEWDGTGEALGGHAVEIVGWGEEAGKKYWIVKNTWGPEWGRDGYFYMVRGKNNCKVEENVISGVPDFFYPMNYETTTGSEFVWAETPQFKAIRTQISSDMSLTGGGIDPETGFVRRAMITKPWYDFTRPIKLEELPDWRTFVAGRDANQIKSESRWGFYLFVILSSLLILLILFRRKKRGGGKNKK